MDQDPREVERLMLVFEQMNIWDELKAEEAKQRANQKRPFM